MKLLERFLKYVSIPTTSNSSSGKSPSTNSQKILAEMLVEELQNLGVIVSYDPNHSYVYGILKGNIEAPKIGFLAHLDTSEDAKGENIQPQIISNYNGKDIYLNENLTMSPQIYPDLKKHKGKTLITTNGETLLGADDKAGIAEIMNMIEYFATSNDAHGDICVCFTPDEEIGEGTKYFDFSKFPAPFAYTVDGSSIGEICYENFNAADVTITIHGIVSHYGTAKGKMVNALSIANFIHQALPPEYPENTEGKEGYYCLHRLTGTPGEAQIVYAIRDFDSVQFQKRKDILSEISSRLEKLYNISIEIEIQDSYYNMYDIIKEHDHLITHAKRAIQASGIIPLEKPIRGGTDGTDLSFMGLPCPNLGTGGHNFHSVYEYITLEDMAIASEVLIGIVKEYASDHELLRKIKKG